MDLLESLSNGFRSLVCVSLVYAFFLCLVSSFILLFKYLLFIERDRNLAIYSRQRQDRKVGFETYITSFKISQFYTQVSKHTPHVSKHTVFPAIHALRDNNEWEIKLLPTLNILKALTFKFEFEYHRAWRMHLKNMIEKLLDRNKNAKKKSISDF